MFLLRQTQTMFSLASGLYAQYFSPQQINLLVVGVKGVGKSTILERIKVTDFPSSSHSHSSNTNNNITKSAPLTIEAAISTITTGSALPAEDMEPLHHHDDDSNRHHPSASSTYRPANNPEFLRTKIFLSEQAHDFDAPSAREKSH